MKIVNFDPEYVNLTPRLTLNESDRFEGMNENNIKGDETNFLSDDLEIMSPSNR